MKWEEDCIGSLREFTSVLGNSVDNDGSTIWTQRRNSNFIDLHL